MITQRARLAALLAAGAVAASCSSTSSPATPSAVSPVAATSSAAPKVTTGTVGDSTTSTPVAGQVKVCKVGNVSGTFTVTTSGLGTVLSPVTIAPGACEVVAEYFQSGTFAQITVTETSAGFQSAQSLETGASTPVAFPNGGTVGINQFHGYTVTVTNNVTTTAGQGCSPGYWKQDQHFDSWPSAYAQTASFNATFGIGTNWFPNSLTLLGSLEQGGGGANALGRQATAALLNAGSGFYPLTTSQVIARVQATYAGTYTIQATQTYFETFNTTLVCPLN